MNFPFGLCTKRWWPVLIFWWYVGPLLQNGVEWVERGLGEYTCSFLSSRPLRGRRAGPFEGHVWHFAVCCHYWPGTITIHYIHFYSFNWVEWNWIPVSTIVTVWPIAPASDANDDECATVSGMVIDKGNWNTRRTPAPVPFCLPHIPHNLIWDWTQAARLESRQLTAWAVAQPDLTLPHWFCWTKTYIFLNTSHFTHFTLKMRTYIYEMLVILPVSTLQRLKE